MVIKHVALLVTLAVAAFSLPAAELTPPAPDAMKQNVVKVLRTSSKAQVNQYVCRVFEVHNCNPYEIINFPELLAEAEEGMIYTFVHPDGNKGKILVTAPEYQMPYYEQLIRELDRPKITSAPGSKYILYRAKNRTAQCLAGLGAYYAGSQDILYPDIETNSVLLFGVPSGCDAANAALSAADVPSPQVLIEVTVYDVKLTNDGRFGFDFHAWKNGPGRALFAGGSRYQYLRIHNVDRDSGTDSGSGYFMDYPSAYFDFLVERGKAKVLTATKVVAMNNRAAQVATGESVLFYRVTQNNVLDRKVTGETQPRTTAEQLTPLAAGAVAAAAQTLGVSAQAPPQLAIDPVRTGIFLDVMPVISLELVDLDILARVVTLVGYDSRGEPVLASRQFSNRAQVPSGQELVIGGLIRDRKAKHAAKIPILGSIPVLGWTFGSETIGAEKTMVVCVIKPTIDKYDSPVRPADADVMAKAKGEQPIPMPPTPFGFDQWGFDRGQ